MAHGGTRGALGNCLVTELKGVGARLAERLERLGISSIQELLFHLPQRYQDRTQLTAIGSLQPGTQAVIAAEIGLAQIRYGRRRSLLCLVSDGTGKLTLRFFHFGGAQQRAFAAGCRILCFGEVRAGPAGMEMVHPEYQLLDTDEEPALEQSLTPIYPTTEGLGQARLRKLSLAALERLEGGCRLNDYLPAPVREKLDFPPLDVALRSLHRPSPGLPLNALEQSDYPPRLRLVFEELLAHHLSLRLLRRRFTDSLAPALVATGKLIPSFLGRLEFSLTNAQQRVVAELSTDLAAEHPMHRLVQGDVGSGKTVVAALAALQAIEAGFQVAIMAPTELLAEQHFNCFQAWFQPLAIECSWLTGKLKAKARRETLKAISSGTAQLLVGTHAVFQEEVKFSRLGLVVIDEQHRFGVHQRLALRNKGVSEGVRPHQMVMTATPIPRTLAMAAYADLDTSTIDELPPGRQPIETAIVSDRRRDEVVERIARACAAGQQAYWVCPLIDESELLQCRAAAETAETLTGALPEVRVGLVHGRMKKPDRDRTMAAFKAGEIDLLVATTVIEVGVDVPNASLMIVDNAERLGLAQLHQLRGRVGRGERQSVCVLLYRSPLSANARSRLQVLRASNDGFEIAQRDLELRGPGEVLGTRQTGAMQFRIADIMRDQALLPQVEKVAEEMLQQWPDQVPPLVRRWVGGGVHYADV